MEKKLHASTCLLPAFDFSPASMHIDIVPPPPFPVKLHTKVIKDFVPFSPVELRREFISLQTGKSTLQTSSNR